jgi:hypothetical protein
MTLSGSDVTHLLLSGTGLPNDVYSGTISSLAPTSGSTLTINDSQSSTVVMNITDHGAVSLSNLATITLSGGINANTVIWNFPNATSLTFGATQWEGTILAPQAAVTYQAAQVDGSLYTESLLGGTEVEAVGFAGAYCPATPPTTVGDTPTTVGTTGTSVPTTPVTQPSREPITTVTTPTTPGTEPSGGSLPTTTVTSSPGGPKLTTAQPPATLPPLAHETSSTGSSTLQVPLVATGEPWSGRMYWCLVGGIGLGGMVLLRRTQRLDTHSPHTPEDQ